jgi:hypothetical protein
MCCLIRSGVQVDGSSNRIKCHPSVTFPIRQDNWKAGREGVPPYCRRGSVSSYPVHSLISRLTTSKVEYAAPVEERRIFA